MKASSWPWWRRKRPRRDWRRFAAFAGGDEACIIGEIREQPAGAVLALTRYGGSRIVDMLVGDPLPRIC